MIYLNKHLSIIHKKDIIFSSSPDCLISCNGCRECKIISLIFYYHWIMLKDMQLIFFSFLEPVICVSHLKNMASWTCPLSRNLKSLIGRHFFLQCQLSVPRLKTEACFIISTLYVGVHLQSSTLSFLKHSQRVFITFVDKIRFPAILIRREWQRNSDRPGV